MNDSTSSIASETDFAAWNKQVDFVMQQIQSESGTTLPLTINAKYLLSRAVSTLAFKQAERNVLSLTTVFLAAVEWGNARDDALPAPASIVRFARRVTDAKPEQYSKLSSEFYASGLPKNIYEFATDSHWPDYVLSQSLGGVLRTMSDVLKTISIKEHVVSVTDVLSTVMQYAGNAKNTSWLSRRLTELDLDADTLVSALQGKDTDRNPTEDTFGFSSTPKPAWIFFYGGSSQFAPALRHQPGHRNTWAVTDVMHHSGTGEIAHDDMVLFYFYLI
ncbi:MAG: hypothetical protein AB8B63_19905 [Granulosicoccus sp.]